MTTTSRTTRGNENRGARVRGVGMVGLGALLGVVALMMAMGYGPSSIATAAWASNQSSAIGSSSR